MFSEPACMLTELALVINIDDRYEIVIVNTRDLT